MKHCDCARRNQPCGEKWASEASKLTARARDYVAMCGGAECRVGEAVYRWRMKLPGWRLERTRKPNTAAEFYVTYLTKCISHQSTARTPLLFSAHQAYFIIDIPVFGPLSLLATLTACSVAFEIESTHSHSPPRGQERMGFLEEAMDTAIDLSNASKALDLANIRFQLM